MKKWVTLAFLCLAFFFYMSDRQLFGLLVPLIREETGLDTIQSGMVDTAMYWMLALSMPFSGFAGDRWPRTRIIACAILGWGALTLLTGFMGGLLGFIMVRSIACTGVQTLYAPSAYALMADEHKATRTTALSLHQGAMYTGMIVSGALVATILAGFGSWRWVYFLFGGATILVGVAFAAVFWRDGRMSADSQKKSFSAGMKAFFCNPAALCAGAGYVALIFAANACMSWAPTFIAEKFSLDVGTVGRGVMFGPNLAAMVTVLCAGFVTDFFVRRFPRFRLMLQIAALLAAVPLFAVFGFASSAGICFAMLVGWGVMRGLFQSNTFTSIFDVVPPESRASAVGFVNVFAYVIGSFAPVLFGFVSHRWGVRGFEVGFASLGALLVSAAAMMAYSYFRLFEKYRVEK
ncbi:MAG: MFS transporter [Kiritimatiellae bacterium]|nr:MFS transporter [Kiritimatiellia bacterium]